MGAFLNNLAMLRLDQRREAGPPAKHECSSKPILFLGCTGSWEWRTPEGAAPDELRDG
jgi:hypothetical protein